MQRELIETNPILKMTFEFSLNTIEYCEKLEAAKKYIVARQLLRSATSIGANSIEAQNPSSKPDRERLTKSVMPDNLIKPSEKLGRVPAIDERAKQALKQVVAVCSPACNM